MEIQQSNQRPVVTIVQLPITNIVFYLPIYKVIINA